MEQTTGRQKTFHFDIMWVFIVGIVAFLLIFQVFPLLYLVVKSFFVDGKFTLDAFSRIYTYDLNWTAMKNTLLGAGGAMVFGVILAYPLAWLVGRTNLYGKNFFRTLFVLTYMVPPYVGAMAWAKLANPSVGIINVFLKNLFHLQEAPLNIYSLGGLIWVFTTFYYPYAFITISRAMEKMDPSLEEASRISGASPIKTVLTVTLPMTMPSIVAAALLVFVAAASCYGIPSIIGAPGNVYTVTTRIIDYVSVGSAEAISDATSLAVFLMVIALVILFVSNFVVGKRQYITVSGKSTRPNIVDLGKWRLPITLLVCLFAFIAIILPFATVIVNSFQMSSGKSLFAPGNFTLMYWKKAIARKSIIEATQNSLKFASLAATFGLFICCIMAYLLERTKVVGRKIPDFLITVGSGMPSVVIALALIMTMRGKFGINIYNTAMIMIIAYMIKYMMMGMRTVVAAFSQISPSLEEAAQISGAGWLRRLKDVVLPLILPSVVAGWFLIFMPSFYELSMSKLLYATATDTIGVELFIYQTYNTPQIASVLATSILLMVVVLDVVLNKLTGGKFSI